MNVLLLTRYGQRGGSSRLRAYQYLPYLAAQGIDVTVVALLSDAYLQDLHDGRRPQWGPIAGSYLRRLSALVGAKRRYDLIWIEYEIFPWLPAWAERWLAATGVPYVVDYDDPIYHRYEMHRLSAIRLLLRRKIDVIMRGAATVIACNDYIGDRARAAGALRIEYLPTVVNLDQYPVRPLDDNSALTIGWIGSPSTAKYLTLVRATLAAFCRDAGARVTMVGAQNPGLDGVPVDVRTWSEQSEVEDVRRFDIGIMPLPDEPWERGKCGFKLIQYMACARPVIASPVGVNCRIVEPGVNGFLAATDQEWRAALEALRAPDLRRQFGQAGRAKVEAEYCTAITAPRLARILRTAAGRGEDRV